MELVSAPSWRELSTGNAAFTEISGAATSSQPITSVGLATDPVTTASIPGPQAYKGCRIISPATTDANAATVTASYDHDVTLIGAPLVEVTYTTASPDVELNTRLWDVAPGGTTQGLVTRGTYRALATTGQLPGQVLRARFQIAPQAYRFKAGHTIKLEITANDAPYRQMNNVPGIVLVDAVTLRFPTH
jgi:predicted acyl esterase